MKYNHHLFEFFSHTKPKRSKSKIYIEGSIFTFSCNVRTNPVSYDTFVKFLIYLNQFYKVVTLCKPSFNIFAVFKFFCITIYLYHHLQYFYMYYSSLYSKIYVPLYRFKSSKKKILKLLKLSFHFDSIQY